MKLSKMPGEDVEEAVSMIRATIKVLVQCSTPSVSYYMVTKIRACVTHDLPVGF
jgi:hypothetical protein